MNPLPDRAQAQVNQPAAGTIDFNAPLEALAEGHGRLLLQCDALLRLPGRVAAEAPDAVACKAASELRYELDLAIARLHQDEERDLFPALLESMGGSDPICIRQMTDARAQEHREIERRWLPLGQWLETVAQGSDRAPEPGAVDSFVSLVRSHIELEDQELLPMAERLISDAAIAEIGEAMRLRHAPAGTRPHGAGRGAS